MGVSNFNMQSFFYDPYLNLLFAIIGAVGINMLPYVNLRELGKSTLTPLFKNKEFVFGMIFLVALAVIVEFLYMASGITPNLILSVHLGASAPAIFSDFAKKSRNSKPRNIG